MGYAIVTILWTISLIVLYLRIKKIKKEFNDSYIKVTQEIERELIQKEKKKIENTAQQELATLIEQSSALQNEIEAKKRLKEALIHDQKLEVQKIIDEFREKEQIAAAFEIENFKRDQTEKAQRELDETLKKIETQKTLLTRQYEEDKEIVEDFHARREAVNAAILRERELKEKEDFFRVQIPVDDQEDIHMLLELREHLHQRESVNKLIFDVYVRRPLSELIKRIMNGRSVSGIYKITYIPTGESYIGRSVDIGTRWTNHIKTICGLEGAAHTTFHTFAAEHGLWNFTFEILEEAPREKLSEREKFYINLYQTNNQFNMSKGG